MADLEVYLFKIHSSFTWLLHLKKTRTSRGAKLKQYRLSARPASRLRRAYVLPLWFLVVSFFFFLDA